MGNPYCGDITYSRKEGRLHMSRELESLVGYKANEINFHMNISEPAMMMFQQAICRYPSPSLIEASLTLSPHLQCSERD